MSGQCSDRHGISDQWEVVPHPSNACAELIEMGRRDVTDDAAGNPCEWCEHLRSLGATEEFVADAHAAFLEEGT